MRRDVWTWLVAVGVLAGGTPVLEAQEGAPDPVAHIDRILQLLGPDRRELVRERTPRVRYRRASAADWQNGRPDLPLFRADRVLVEERTLVEVAIRAGESRGDLHLSANLQTESGSFVTEEIGGNEGGIYEIRDAPERLGGLELYVERGSLALDWVRGRLSMFAGGIRSVVDATRLVLTTSADGQLATLHLIEGRVHFPDFPGTFLAAGQTALLRAGLPPQISNAGIEASREFDRAAKWAQDEAWPRPFYAKPWPYLGIAVGALAWAAQSGGDGGGRSGTVILSIPIGP